ncbi:MAG: hypothetical protein JNL97_14625, partial [Verrucomicrobiales bacterium]|nr:hypothetical protein [Verrucomicrobiales bacterium]
MRRRTRLWIGLLLAALVALVLYAARIPAPPQRDPLPQPNGYDDFVAATKLVRGEFPREDRKDPAATSNFLAENGPALERLRVGLSRASLVNPLDATNAQARLDEAGGMKTLALLVAAEAQAARERQDWDRLVASASEGVDFGLRLARGGVMLDQMISSAAESMARRPLEEALAVIPAEPAKKAARTLSSLESSRESFARVRLNEDAFVRRTSNPLMRVAWTLFLRRRVEATYVRTEQNSLGNVFATRNLAQNLAA